MEPVRMMKYLALLLSMFLASEAYAYSPPTNCPTSTGELNFSTTTNAFSCNPPITLGTVTTGVWQGTPIVNTYIGQLVGNTLTNGDWCTSNGTIINCATAAPVTSIAGDGTYITNSTSTGVVTLTTAFGTAALKNTGTSGANVPLLNGSNTASGSNVQSGSFAVTGTSTPTQSAGTLGLAGTATKPTLAANSEGDIFLTSADGFNIIGQGSTNDFRLWNSSGTSICAVATGTTNFNCTGLQVGGTSVLTANQTITLSGDTTGSGTTAITTSTVKVNGGSIPASATALASNSSNQIIAATYQGNGSKVQLSTGSTMTNDCVKFDANGNTVDAGAACGGGGGVTWPTTGDIVVSNSTSSPTGIAPVNGDCVVGSGGAWVAGSCSGTVDNLGNAVKMAMGTTNFGGLR